MFDFNLGMLNDLEEKVALAQAAGLIPQSQPQPVAAPVSRIHSPLCNLWLPLFLLL